jgi:hypothetical protein
MAKDTALIKKREELKRRLAEGEYKTLVDVVLTGACFRRSLAEPSHFQSG